MRRRIKKKKGLLKDPVYEAIRQRWIAELELEMQTLEERAEKRYAEDPDFVPRMERQLNEEK